jgi:hypothetical protein
MLSGSDGTGPLDLASGARDLLTDGEGASVELDRAAVSAWLDADRRLTSFHATPAIEASQGLRGLLVGKGFRAEVDAAMPGDRTARSLRYRLVQELPVAALISGYVMLYRRRPLGSSSAETPPHRVPVDICSGWRGDGVMMRSLAERGEIPVPIGPVAPPLDVDDPAAWHEMPPLATNAMRRQRLIDVSAGARPEFLSVYAMFRDTYVEPEGTETVLHQYELHADLERHRRVIVACTAVPNVLPFPECPAAAASTERLVGRTLDAIPAFVREDLRGTSTCTHLNDLFTVLGDAASLIDALEAAAHVR